jgi:hypothetical protein
LVAKLRSDKQVTKNDWNIDIDIDTIEVMTRFQDSKNRRPIRPLHFIIAGDKNQIPAINKVDLFKDRVTFAKAMFDDAEELTVDYRNDKDIIELRDAVLNHVPLTFDMFAKLSTDYDLYHPNSMYQQLMNVGRCYGEELHRGGESYKAQTIVHIACKRSNKNAVNFRELELRGYVADFVNHSYSTGVRLVCRKADKKLKLLKGGMYEITDKVHHVIEGETRKAEIEKNRIHPYLTLRSILGDRPICIRADKVADHFDVGYCVTAHVVQGLTITHPIYIHNAHEMYDWDNRILYTAITRAKSIHQIKFVNSIYRGMDKAYDEVAALKRHQKKFDLVDVDEEKMKMDTKY